AAIDAVFARADSERAERTAEERQALEASANLCAELEATASADSPPERAEVQRIESACCALVCSEPALRARYHRAHTAHGALKSKLDKDKRRAHFDIWIAHHDLLRQLETQQIDDESFTTARTRLAAVAIAADGFMARIEALAAGSDNTVANSADLRDCVLE